MEQSTQIRAEYTALARRSGEELAHSQFAGYLSRRAAADPVNSRRGPTERLSGSRAAFVALAWGRSGLARTT